MSKSPNMRGNARSKCGCKAPLIPTNSVLILVNGVPVLVTPKLAQGSTHEQ